MKQENSELKELLTHVGEQVKEAGKYEGDLRRSRDEVEDLRCQVRAQEEVFNRKYSQKKKEFKAKIEEYKGVIVRLRDERQSLLAQHDPSAQVEDRITNIMREKEKKLSELRNTKERELAEEKRSHEYRVC